MLSFIFALLLLLGATMGHLGFKNPHCGATISFPFHWTVPSHKHCWYGIDVPIGKSLYLVVYSKDMRHVVDCEHYANAVRVISSNGEEHSTCSEDESMISFSGPSDFYIVDVRGLSKHNEIRIRMVNVALGCSDTIRSDMMGQELMFEHTGEEDCSIRMPTNAILEVYGGDSECGIKYELSQGQIFRNPTKSDASCVGLSKVYYDLICPSVVLSHLGNEGEKMKIRVNGITMGEQAIQVLLSHKMCWQ